MKVVHTLTRIRLEEGGVVRAVLDLCASFAQAGHEVVLIVHDDTDAPPEWKSAPPGAQGAVRIVRLDAPSRPMGLYAPAQLAPAREAIAGADVLHLHTPWEASNLQFARLARAEGVPYVLTIHGMLDDWSMSQRGPKKRAYLALVGRRLLERAAYVHCTAQAEMDQSKKWYPKGRGRVVPLIFDLSLFRDLPGPGPAERAYPLARDERPKALFLSRLHEKKGAEHLIDAVALLRKEGTDCVLLIAGTGEPVYESSLRTRVEQAGLTGCTAFLGLVVGEEKVSLFECADVFVLPTSQENFGFVAPEAMACRTPVVTTRGVDIWPELVESGGALIVEPTARAIADAVASLLRDDERRRTMGEKARAWVLDHLDAGRILREYERMYADAKGVVS